jgi:ankyrin repeat protein
MKYSILDAAAEPKLPYVLEALLLTCTQDAPLAERKTHLIISAQKGLAGATRIFLNLNVDKDAKDNSGWTALHHAVENGSEAVVRLLLEQRADKRIRDNCKETALHIAVKKL